MRKSWERAIKRTADRGVAAKDCRQERHWRNTTEIRNPEAMLTRVEKTAAFFPDGTFLRLVRLCLVAYNLLRISQSPTRLRHLFKRLTVARPSSLLKTAALTNSTLPAVRKTACHS